MECAAAVEMLKVAVALVVEALRSTEVVGPAVGAVNAQETSAEVEAGLSAQESETVPLKPAVELTMIVDVPELPGAEMEMAEGVPETE